MIEGRTQRIQQAKARLVRIVNKKCLDCGIDISGRGNRSTRCIECQRKKRNDKRNLIRKEFRFNNFLLRTILGEDGRLEAGEPYQHISARATKDARDLDKLCFTLSDSELQALYGIYKRRFKEFKNDRKGYEENIRLIDIIGDHYNLRNQNIYNDDCDPDFRVKGTISDETLALMGKEARDRDLSDRMDVSELERETLKEWEKEIITPKEECVDDGFNRSKYTENINKRLDKCLYVKDGKIIEYNGKDYDKTDLRNRMVIDEEGWETVIDDYEDLQERLTKKKKV